MNTLLSSLLPLHRTIVYLSIVYTVGQVILAVSAIHDITDKNKDGTPDDITLHMWVERTLNNGIALQGKQLIIDSLSVLCFALRALSMVGLLLIALGTGGIKPCVAAFGGDQFQDHQVRCHASVCTHVISVCCG